ncbi:4-hydroxy-3-methylbut-2-enyl diphosphate reductase [Rubritalea profundi]|uniref:4-hydroxy-3-methylbut-2-enyl diphosphate reductase n=1 Tax=Rubritalea profundi TaxID=1658618 RepID=A0A2S7TZ55_9BACT|nr:4-hydroxy-3-methylbut-2-enyl diphosphate reductase [Rubritalea profundi]PQJ27537.1 4-hydroxy-3-methylbut-2-enyl diphosphate reductase [Rubritalea profundi]
MSDAKPKKRKRINVRRPDVMEKVQAEVRRHFESSIVEKIRANDGSLTVGHTTIKLARQFGFCYGVERAIDLAYAARKVFADNNIYLIGEIIHNQEVNRQLEDMNIVSLPWKEMDEQYDQLTEDDVVIVPAFGAPTSYIEKIEERGAAIVDTTCGDVMKVWRRVRTYAKQGYTSIIHGKAGHEETRATASRALGDAKDGHYIVILTLADTDYLCDFLKGKVSSEDLMKRFSHAVSEGFDPDLHLNKVGVANQTTMLKSETEEIQKRVCRAITERDGKTENFQFFDTICGATQERQDALFEMLKSHMDVLLVVGGYNSSNTAHLVEIGKEELPTFFIQNSDRLTSLQEIVHFDLEHKSEVTTEYTNLLDTSKDVIVGVTAGASCPNNLIESTIQRIFELRGVDPQGL